MSLIKAAIPVLIFLFLSVQTVFADAGPKPGMNFRMVYKTSKPVKVLEGWQLQSPFESFTVSDTLKNDIGSKYADYLLLDSIGSKTGLAPGLVLREGHCYGFNVQSVI